MKLVKNSEVSEKEYIKYITEWEESNELIIPMAARRDGLSFKDLRINWEEAGTDSAYSKGWVPSTIYFLIDDEEKILGAIHFRHELNDRLKSFGGHIGFGIRPSCRLKGYGHIILKEMLSLKKEYNKFLITCDDDNIASAKTIESCGGILENKLVFEGVLVRRYWIHN